MLLYKYRPWNAFTVEVLRDRRIFFPIKHRLNDPAELVHPVRFENSFRADAFRKAESQIRDETFELADSVREKFDFLDAIRPSHPEVEHSPQYGYDRFFHIKDRHWRCVEAVCDQLDVHQSIAFYAFNLMQDRIDLYDTDEGIIRRLNNKLERIGILSLAARSDCPVMWAHYANNHEGVALIFDTELDAVLKKVEPVRYLEERPESAVDSVVSNLYKKGKSWKYEREYRTLVGTGDISYSFTPRALNGIILGARMNDENLAEALSIVSKDAQLTVYCAYPSATTYMVDHKPIHQGGQTCASQF